MISRLVIIFLIIGSGYVFSVFALKTLAGMIALPELAGIGKIDSYIQLIIGVLGFGMQTDAMRKIASTQNWKPIFFQAQSARVTLSVVLLPLIVIAWLDKFWLVLALAPIIAASGDYALYARGSSVSAAIIAWLRVVAPLSTCMVVARTHPQWVVSAFFVSTGLVFISTNFAIAKVLKTKFRVGLSLGSLRLYQQTFPIGIINLCLYFFGLGVIILAQPFYDDSAIAVSFLALKFYVIYKGAVRVMHQAFVAQMLSREICFTLDRLSMMTSLFVLTAVIFFPETLIRGVFGEQFINDRLLFGEIAFAALVFSISSSLPTHLLLKHEDWPLMKLCIGSVAVAVFVLVASSCFTSSAVSLAASLVAGELAMLVGLVAWFHKHFQIGERLQFLFFSALSLTLPAVLRYFFGDTLLVLTIGLALMGLTLLALNYNWIFANLRFLTPHGTNNRK